MPHTLDTSLRSSLLAALQRVRWPDGTPVTDHGGVSGLTLRGDGQDTLRVGFVLTALPAYREAWQSVQAACEQAALSVPGVEAVTIVVTAESGDLPEGGAHHATSKTVEAPRVKAQWNREPIPHVRRVVAVASGKGGVGKSTTAVMLALTLAAAGKRVGLLDADIYGPSLPTMLGVHGQPAFAEGKMQPHRAHGLACMSMGFILGDQAAIMRGPMITKSLQQLLRGTAWGTPQAPLDMLLIDLPPGTGDVHLSLAQQAPLDGAILVTTPQEVALADALKAGLMFQKVGVPLLGVVENMSGFTDPEGRVHAIFGEGGGRRLAETLHCPLLAQIPIDIALRAGLDAGQPPASALAHYRAVAAALANIQ